MTSSIYSALSGIHSHLESFEKTADRIAHQAPHDDLAKDMVQLIIDKQGVETNAATIRIADQMIGTLLDVLA